MLQKIYPTDKLNFEKSKSIIVKRTRMFTLALILVMLLAPTIAFIKGDIFDIPKLYWVIAAITIGITIALNFVDLTPERLEALRFKQLETTKRPKKSSGLLWTALMSIYFSAYIYFEKAYGNAFAWTGILYCIYLFFRKIR